MRTAYSNGISSEEGGRGVWAKQGSRHEARSHFKWILYSFREWKRNSAFCTSYFFNRSFNPFFFSIIPQVRFVVSRGTVIPRIFFENMFSGKKKNRKRKPNYRNRYTFQIYIQFSATFPISLTDFIHSVPSFNILFFFPRWLFETLFGVPEVSVGSRSNSRIHGGVSLGSSSSSLSRTGNRSISTRGRAPDADFNQTIARRIDHSISFDVR